MKVFLQFNINGGGMLHAEVESITEAQDFLSFAANIGVIRFDPVLSEPEGKLGAAPAAEAPAEPAAAKPAKAKKEKPAKTEEAEAPAGKPAQPAEAATPSNSAQGSESAATAEPSATVTADEAAQAVKDYAARTSIDQGRALLAKFGFKRTSDITPEKAAEVLAATKE